MCKVLWDFKVPTQTRFNKKKKIGRIQKYRTVTKKNLTDTKKSDGFKKTDPFFACSCEPGLTALEIYIQ
jgi:hypothetical protein